MVRASLENHKVKNSNLQYEQVYGTTKQQIYIIEIYSEVLATLDTFMSFLVRNIMPV